MMMLGKGKNKGGAVVATTRRNETPPCVSVDEEGERKVGTNRRATSNACKSGATARIRGGSEGGEEEEKASLHAA